MKRVFQDLLFVSVILCTPIAGYGEEISFKGPGQYFTTTHSKVKLNYSDSAGLRSLEIKGCNRIVIEKFWNELLGNLKSLQLIQDKNSLQVSNAIVTYSGLNYGVLDFEPAYTFFRNVPKRIHVVFAESERVCKAK